MGCQSQTFRQRASKACAFQARTLAEPRPPWRPSSWSPLSLVVESRRSAAVARRGEHGPRQPDHPDPRCATGSRRDEFLFQELGAEFGPDHVYKWHPWLPFYLLAGFFRVFGVGTYTARLAFRLPWHRVESARLLSLAWPFSRSGAWQLRPQRCWSSRSLSAPGQTVPILQPCHVPVLAWTLWLRQRQVSPGAGPGLGAALLHAELYFLTLWATVILHAMLFKRERRKELLLLFGLSTAACVPWLLYTLGLSYRNLYPGMYHGRAVPSLHRALPHPNPNAPLFAASLARSCHGGDCARPREKDPGSQKSRFMAGGSAASNLLDGFLSRPVRAQHRAPLQDIWGP